MVFEVLKVDFIVMYGEVMYMVNFLSGNVGVM